MNYPENLFYTKEHEWISFDGDHAVIGITDFAQKELGDIVYLDITTLHETVGKDKVFGTVEAVKTVSDLFMPITGTIVEINSMINDNPELVNKEPYANGWIIKVKVINPAEKSELLSANTYKKLIGA